MKKVTFDLTGKVALVIGGTSGIGEAIALEYANWGAHVVAVGRRADRCREVAAEIRAAGVETLEYPMDATDKAQIEALCQATIEKFGRIDILANCAGINRRHNAEDFPMEDYDEVMDINVRSVFMCTQIVGRQMIQQGYGKIVNISSMTAFLGSNRIAAYCASKGAVGQLTKAFAVEWTKYNIQVNCIAPGYFATDLTAALHTSTEASERVLRRVPMQRWGQVEELAGAAIFLASDASSYVTGSTVVVDGGMLAFGV